MSTSGLCGCGCGQTTARARQNLPKRGYRKGDHLRFVTGHNGRMKGGEEIAPRFWPKVEKSEGCWEWRAHRLKRTRHQLDYGRMKAGGGLRLAHRVSWELHFGPIPPGMCVLHRCDNPGCVRPDHLLLGTIADNNADKANKGRSRSGKQKLTEGQVRAIRDRYAAGGASHASLALEHGVSKAAVSALLAGRSWRNVA